MSFLAANTQDGFGAQRDKKVPRVYNEIYCCIFDVVGLYFYWRSWTSCLDTWHHWFYQIPTDKNQKVTDSVRNLIMGHVWIFQPYNNPNAIYANLKNNTKMGHWAQNQASAMAFPVLWPEPYRKRVKWTEEKRRSTVMELWIWRIWRDSGWRNGLWSLVRCSLTSSGIIGENSYTIFANGGFKVLNKRVPIIVSNVY